MTWNLTTMLTSDQPEDENFWLVAGYSTNIQMAHVTKPNSSWPMRSELEGLVTAATWEKHETVFWRTDGLYMLQNGWTPAEWRTVATTSPRTHAMLSLIFNDFTSLSVEEERHKVQFICVINWPRDVPFDVILSAPSVSLKSMFISGREKYSPRDIRKSNFTAPFKLFQMGESIYIKPQNQQVIIDIIIFLRRDSLLYRRRFWSISDYPLQLVQDRSTLWICSPLPHPNVTCTKSLFLKRLKIESATVCAMWYKWIG